LVVSDTNAIDERSADEETNDVTDGQSGSSDCSNDAAREGVNDEAEHCEGAIKGAVSGNDNNDNDEAENGDGAIVDAVAGSDNNDEAEKLGSSNGAITVWKDNNAADAEGTSSFT
jgi:hypothetical protein